MRSTVSVIACIAFLTSLSVAQAECGKWQGKPSGSATQIRSPTVEDSPYGTFNWGTSARILDGAAWWVENTIWNVKPGPALVGDWAKGGLHLLLQHPLAVGEVACRKELLAIPVTAKPTLDYNAPIVYSIDKHEQKAAVYAASQMSAKSSSSTMILPLPATGSLQDIAETDIETSYLLEDKVVQRVAVHISSRYLDGKFVLGIKSNLRNFPIGISTLPDVVTPVEAKTLPLIAARAGLRVEHGTLAQYAGAEQMSRLNVAYPDIAPNGRFYFFTFLKEENVSLDYAVSKDARIRRQKAVAVILDRARKPILAADVTVLAPQEAK